MDILLQNLPNTDPDPSRKIEACPICGSQIPRFDNDPRRREHFLKQHPREVIGRLHKLGFYAEAQHLIESRMLRV